MILKGKSTAEEVNKERDKLIKLINENIKVAQEKEKPKETNDTPPPVMSSNGGNPPPPPPPPPVMSSNGGNPPPPPPPPPVMSSNGGNPPLKNNLVQVKLKTHKNNDGESGKNPPPLFKEIKITLPFVVEKLVLEEVKSKRK